MKTTKKLLFGLLIFMLLAVIPMSFKAEAATFSGSCGDNVHWQFNDMTGELTISGKGEIIWSPWRASSYQTSIHSVEIEDGVTGICREAFYGCTSISKITIPDSVTSIGYNVFYNTAYYNNSDNWENDVLYVGNHLIKAKTSLSGAYEIKDGTVNIANEAFYNCTSLTSITIPEGVTSIGDYTFYNCNRLTNVAIPEGVTSIGGYTFYNCNRLTNVTIPDSVTRIGDYAFYYCYFLKNITIPGSVTSIGNWAFALCTSLTSETIPDGVTNIGYCAFYNCIRLNSIIISDSVEKIDVYAFSGTAYYNDSNNWENDVLYIGNHLIKAKTSLSGVYVIKDGTVNIADEAFYNCRTITGITFPDTLKTIGFEAFRYCTNITDVTFSENLTVIGHYAFYGCESLESVVIPDSVTTVRGAAFYGCSNLESVKIGNGVRSIGRNTFYNCSKLASVTLGSSVKLIRDWAFYGCYNLKTVNNYSVLPVTAHSTKYGYVGYYADTVNWYFDEESGECGDNLTYIFNAKTGELKISGTGAITDYRIPWYTYRSDIKSINMENGVTSISAYAFNNCYSLTSVTIPDSVTDIGKFAFLNCNSLDSVTIGKNVTSIGDYAFFNCYKLKTVNNYSSLNIVKRSLAHGYVAYYAYTVNYFGTLTGECGDNVTYTYNGEIGSLTISGAGAMTAYSNYRDIPWYSQRALIKTIVIENGVTKIGSHAFRDLTNLNSVTLPDTLQSVSAAAFYKCYALSDVYYNGMSETEWKQIVFNSYNTYLLNATRHYTYHDGHNLSKNVRQEPTCSTEGYTADVYCNDCGIVVEGYAKLSETNLHIDSNKDDLCDDCDYLIETITLGEVKTVDLLGYGKTMFKFIPEISGEYRLNAKTAENQDYHYVTNYIYDSEMNWITQETSGGSDWSCAAIAELEAGKTYYLVTGFYYNGEYHEGKFDIQVACSSNICEHSAKYACDAVAPTCTEYGFTAGEYCPYCITWVSGHDMVPATGHSFGDDLICDVCLYEKMILTSGVCGDDLTYTLYEDGDFVVSGTGDMYDYEYSGPWYRYRNRISKVIIEDGVTSIGRYAFYEFKKLKSVTIGKDVTNIGAWAFYFCENLKDVNNYSSLPIVAGYNPGCFTVDADYYGIVGYYTDKINWYYSDSGKCGENLTYNVDLLTGVLTVSGTGAMDEFDYSDLLLSTLAPWKVYDEHVYSIVIENGVTSIGESAFRYFKNLKSVTIPKSVTEISRGAFHDCISLTDVYYGGYYESDWDEIEIKRLNYYLNNSEIHYSVCEEHNKAEFEKVVIKGTATCKKSGTADSYACAECGYIVSGGEEISALGHDYIVTTVESTCTVKGTKTTTCSRCDYEDTEKLPLESHSYGEWKTEKEATCLDNGKEIRVCSCGEEESRKTPLKAHTYGEWKTEKEATCSDYGEEVRACSCGKQETRKTALKAHTYSEWAIIVEPTCERSGIETRICSCGMEQLRTVAATGHVDGADEDTNCDLCDKQLGSESDDVNEEDKTFMEKMQDFFQKIMDWFKNLFKIG